MKFLIATMAIIALFHPGQGIAQAKKPNKKKKVTTQETVQPPSSVLFPSKTARTQKQFGAGLQTGLVLGGVTGGGAEAFWQSPMDFQVGVRGVQGTGDHKEGLEDDIVGVDKAMAEGSLFTVQGKYFFGNSFFMAGGLGFRRYVLKYDFYSKLIPTERAMGTITADSFCANITIGNIWVFDSGLFLGADWIGYTIPFSSSSKVDTDTEGDFMTESQKDIHQSAEKAADSLGSSPSAQALIFNIGFLF